MSCRIGWPLTKGWPLAGTVSSGVSQGGYAAAALATFHPDRFRYAGSLSGFLAPERTGVDGTITAALKQGGADSDHMWGLPQLGRWKWHSPNQNVQQLVDNNTRLWVYSPGSGAPTTKARWSATAISPKAPTRRSIPLPRRRRSQRPFRLGHAVGATTGRPGGDSWAQCPATLGQHPLATLRRMGAMTDRDIRLQDSGLDGLLITRASACRRTCSSPSSLPRR